MQTETRTYTLAYSPCPNDTYIFAALTNGLLEDAPRVRVHLADIEELNAAAANGSHELIKVSYGAIPYLMDRYRILRSGGALGHGCGPLLVTRNHAHGESLGSYREKRIAIPGERTTAFMLLQLALGGRPQARQMRFDRIIDAVAAGDVDAGLIIHESRFTYEEAGLISLVDLGDWWESQHGLPIPLGAILVRRDVPIERARELDQAIRRSLAFSREHEDRVMPYVRSHAFEMSDELMRKHIALYVNDHSLDVGETGERAVHALFARARSAGILAHAAVPEFV